MSELGSSHRMHPDYAAQLSTPGRKAWSEAVVDLTDDPSTRPQAEERIIAVLRHTYPTLGRVGFPKFNWVVDEGVKNTVGRDIAVPVLTLDRTDMVRFARAGLVVPQGLTLTIPTEVVARRRYTAPDVRGLGVVFVPGAEHDSGAEFAVDYVQRRRHELVHAIDPNTRATQEEGILRELTAVVGELTDPARDFYSGNVDPRFWIHYLEGMEHISNELLDVLGPARFTVGGVAESLSKFVRIQTTKQRNSDLVRKLMACANSKMLKEKFPQN